jgi:hypothetical protein
MSFSSGFGGVFGTIGAWSHRDYHPTFRRGICCSHARLPYLGGSSRRRVEQVCARLLAKDANTLLATQWYVDDRP